MKRVVIGMFCVLMAVSLVVAGCGGGEKKADPAKPVVLKLGHVVDANHVWNRAAVKFAESVEKKTNGTVKIQVYNNSQLGNDRDLAEGMKMGSIHFSLIAGVMGNFYPPIQLLEMPYLFESQDHLRKVIYGPVGEEIKAGLKKSTGIMCLDFWERSPRQLTSSKPVNKIDDIKGLKIRVPEIPPMVAAWKAMGANPTPMAWGEVYTGLQQGTIDAQENPFANILSAKIEEVNKYVAITDHVYGYVMLLMDEKAYNKLTPDQQKAIMEAAKEVTQWQNKIVAEEEARDLKTLQSKGITITKPDKAEFIKRAKTTHGEFANKYGKELYEKIVNANKK